MTPKAINNARGKRSNQWSHDLCMTHWAPSLVIIFPIPPDHHRLAHRFNNGSIVVTVCFTSIRSIEAMSHEQNPQNN